MKSSECGFKRTFDFICSLAGLVLLSPFLVWIAIRIKSEDHGPVFYRPLRVGLHGEQFRLFKFRTMVVNADTLGPSSTANEDPRITSAGCFLRKYKLDELPQLLNVLVGEMSIVGPRPEIKHFTDMYNEDERAILSVRPGITDWASIWNADEGAVLTGASDPDKAYMELIRPTKIALQLKYVREHSFFTDLKIICLTLLAIVQLGSQAVQDIRENSGRR